MYTDNGGNHAMIWLCYRLPLFFQGILYKQRPIFLLHLCNLLSQLALFLEVCNRRSIFILPCHRNVFKLLNQLIQSGISLNKRIQLINRKLSLATPSTRGKYTMLMTVRKTNDIPTDPDSRVNFLIYPPSSTRSGFIHSLQNLDRYKFPAVDEILMSV
jgi:hypothetical protein